MEDPNQVPSADVAKVEEGSKVRIFDLYSKSHKSLILLACAGIALLTPFTDTIYLPALRDVGETLHASDTNVALTVSTYMASAAVGQVCWGCVSDYYGRLPTLYIGIVLYFIFTVACIFPTNIEALIALRAVEGLVIGSSIVTVTAMIADVYEPAERGTAMGAFLTPLLVGPVIAPVIGGALSEAFSWRATFVLLSAMTIPLSILSFYVLPETHHYFVVQRIAASNAKYSEVPAVEASDIEQAVVSDSGSLEMTSAIPVAVTEGDNEKTGDQSETQSKVIHLVEAEGMVRDKMVMPWESLGFIIDPQLAPSYMLMGIVFSTVFTTLTTLPLCLSQAPYNLSMTNIGLLYLPGGVSMYLASQVGGRLSDRSAARYPATNEGRLVYSIPFLLIIPISAVAFGFSLAYGANLGYVLVSQCVLTFAECTLLPTMMGYLTTCRPRNASAVTSILTFVCFACSAICISVAPVVTAAIGVEYFYLIMAGLSTVVISWSIYDITTKAMK